MTKGGTEDLRSKRKSGGVKKGGEELKEELMSIRKIGGVKRGGEELKKDLTS